MKAKKNIYLLISVNSLVLSLFKTAFLLEYFTSLKLFWQ